MTDKPNNLQVAVAKAIKKEAASGDFDEKGCPPVENAGGAAKHTATKASPAATKSSAIRKPIRAVSKPRSGTAYPSNSTSNPRRQRIENRDGGEFIYRRNPASNINRRLMEKPSHKWLIRQKDALVGSLKFATAGSALKLVAKNPYMQESVFASFMDRISAVEATHGEPMLATVQYIAKISAYPDLTNADEQALAHERKRKPKAATVLFKCHMKFAYGLAKSMCGFSQSLEDMVQAANIGLWKAVKRFEPGHKAVFTTHAHNWIKKEMLDYLSTNKSAVSFTGEAARKMMFKLRNIKKQKGWDELTEAQASEVANELGVKTSDVMAMEVALRRHNQAIDDDFQLNEYADESTGEERLIAGLDAKAQLERMYAMLAKMPDRDRDIFKGRHIKKNKESLQLLANRWNISVERVRQIEEQIIAKLKRGLNSRKSCP